MAWNLILIDKWPPTKGTLKTAEEATSRMSKLVLWLGLQQLG